MRIWSAAVSFAMPRRLRVRCSMKNLAPRPSLLARRPADVLLAGSVSRWPMAGTTCAFGCGTWCACKIWGHGLPVGASDLRLAAHRMADYIYEKLTGEKGVFQRASPTSEKRRALHLAGCGCGWRKRPGCARRSRAHHFSGLVTHGAHLAYVSFESRKPVIYSRNCHRAQAFAGQFQRLQQCARLVARWQKPAGHAHAGRALAALQHRSVHRLAHAPDPVGGIDTEPCGTPPEKHLLRQRPWRCAADLPHGRTR